MKKIVRCKGKQKIIIILVVGIVFLFSAGYAAFSSNFLISGKGKIIEKPITIEQLKESKVTEGDGLYEDVTEDNKYIYKGANPNNYITFNEEFDGAAGWRILSLENNGTLKIIRASSIGDKAYDLNGNRTTGYCSQGHANTYGCNAWMKLDNFVCGSYSGNVESDSELNTYLNGEYYNNLSTTAKSQMVSGKFNVGPVLRSDVLNEAPLSNIINEEKTYLWDGNIALPTVSEYVKASNNVRCISAYIYRNVAECYSNSETHNWIYNINKTTTNTWMWLLSSNAREDLASSVFMISNDGHLGYDQANYTTFGVAPVLYLDSNISLSGKGTENDPYTIIKK